MLYFVPLSLIALFTARFAISFNSNVCTDQAKFGTGKNDCMHSVRWRGKSLSRKPLPHLFAMEDFHDGAIAVDYKRRRATLGKVPIISRMIPVGINVPDEPSENCTKKTLNVTIWEMERPSDIIQMW